MTSQVAVISCGSYDEAAVDGAVGRGLSLLGGAARFVQPGDRIVLKPNLLVAASPDGCVTTHPSVFRAVARHLLSAGAVLTHGDSPAFGSPGGVARQAGIAAVAEELGVALADFSSGRDVSFPEGEMVKRWHIANSVLDADGLVSLPKLKAHRLTRITGAVKNVFGCVPGIRKGELHARMGDEDRFCRMLVDCCSLVRPRLHVMDGVMAMEGNGPRGGDPRKVGVLLVSEDPVALDAVACRLIGLDARLVRTVVHGEAVGLGSADAECVGDPLEPLIVEDFVVNRVPGPTTGGRGLVSRLFRDWVTPRPTIMAERCTACGTCVEMCPVDPKAVDWTGSDAAEEGRPPVFDYGECIRCYCCQETCPERAIEVVVPPLGRLVHGR